MVRHKLRNSIIKAAQDFTRQQATKLKALKGEWKTIGTITATGQREISFRPVHSEATNHQSPVTNLMMTWGLRDMLLT